jgi:hypothetical protein
MALIEGVFRRITNYTGGFLLLINKGESAKSVISTECGNCRFLFVRITAMPIRGVKIDVYDRRVTANFKSYFEINCKLFEVRTICALKWKNELPKNLSKPSETCRSYLQMRIEVFRLWLPVCRKRQS